jgi:hypothetical protein
MVSYVHPTTNSLSKILPTPEIWNSIMHIVFARQPCLWPKGFFCVQLGVPLHNVFVFSSMLELLKFAKHYPFENSLSPPNKNDIGLAPKDSSICSFPGYSSLRVKDGRKCKSSDNSTDQSVIKVKNGHAACLPGSTSSKVKALRIHKHSQNSSD